MDGSLAQTLSVAFWVRSCQPGDQLMFQRALRCLRSPAELDAGKIYNLGAKLGFWAPVDPSAAALSSLEFLRAACRGLTPLLEIPSRELVQLDLSLAVTPEAVLEASTALLLELPSQLTSEEHNRLLACLPGPAVLTRLDADRQLGQPLRLPLLPAQETASADVPPLPGFAGSSSSRVFLHPPLIRLISEFAPNTQLDATCRAVKNARLEAAVVFRLTNEGSRKYMRDEEFRVRVNQRSKTLYLKVSSKDRDDLEFGFQAQREVVGLEVSVYSGENVSLFVERLEQGDLKKTRKLIMDAGRFSDSGESLLSALSMELRVYAPELESLSLVTPSYSDLDKLHGLKELEKLTLQVFNSGPSGVDLVPSSGLQLDLPKLKLLHLRWSERSILRLGVLPSVTLLEFTETGTPVTSEMARNFPNLRSFIDSRYSSQSIPNDLNFLASWTQLHYLKIRGNQLPIIPRDLKITNLTVAHFDPPANVPIVTIPAAFQIQTLKINGSLSKPNAAKLRCLSVKTLDLTDAIFVCGLDFLQTSFPALQVLKMDQLREHDFERLNKSTTIKLVCVKKPTFPELSKKCKVPIQFI